MLNLTIATFASLALGFILGSTRLDKFKRDMIKSTINDTPIKISDKEGFVFIYCVVEWDYQKLKSDSKKLHRTEEFLAKLKEEIK